MSVSIEILQYSVGIEGVCAWPKAIMLEDGRILAAGFDQPVPGLWSGNLGCWLSDDDGSKWRRVGTLNEVKRGRAYLNCAIGECDGRILSMYAGFYNRPDAGTCLPIEERYTLQSACGSSEDFGVTWSKPVRLDMPYEECKECTPFGRINDLGNGTKGTVLYGYQNECRSEAYLYLYRDRKWRFECVINEDGPSLDESEIVKTRERFIVVGRSYPGAMMAMFASQDLAQGWRFEGYLTDKGNSSGSTILWKGDMLVLTHRTLVDGEMGIGVKVSEDGGTNWSDTSQLIGICRDEPNGHPTTVHLGGGRFLTCYLARFDSADGLYGMGSIKWRIHE